MKFLAFCLTLLSLIKADAAEICTSKICEFNFNVHHGRSMTYRWQGRTYNVVLNGTKLAPETPDRFKRPLPDQIPLEDVITADGIQRNVLTINGQFPGPTIEVMEGAQVVVHVTNYLLTKGISFHWHGMHQRGTTWMDGVSFVSQCPIIPGQSFTYRFHADPVGTHWYHDHHTNLRVDGLYGLFVVHPKLPSLPEKHLLLADWYSQEADTLEITNFGPLNGAGNQIAFLYDREYGPDNVFLSPYFFESALINGRGHSNNNNAPLTTYTVVAGNAYRFRTLNAASKYGFEISIDGHELDVVALDGHEINPIRVDSIMMNPGERVDFTVSFDQPRANYWMRSLTLRLGTGHYPTDDGVEKGTYAIVHYDGAPGAMPTTNRTSCTAQNTCVIFNCPWSRFADNVPKRCIQVDQARSATPKRLLDEEYGLSGPVDLELFLNMGFHAAASVNGKKFLPPTLPWSEPNYLDGQVTCDRPDCDMADSGCACTQVINLPFNKTVQFVMANYRPNQAVTHHGMHLHGHNFAVLKLGLPSINRSTGYTDEYMYNEDLECVNSFCKNVRWKDLSPELNLENPPVKDTVNVAARGYTVVRFRTNNPGAWFFHCHITNHVSEGMALVFDEAHDRHPKPPKNFPRCPSFKWTESEFQSYMAQYSGEEQHRPLDNSDMTPNRDNQTPKENTDQTPKENTDPKENKDPKDSANRCDGGLGADYFANHVSLLNRDFIGLIVGCVCAGAVLVFIAFIIASCGISSKRNSASFS